jgi:hypothetical protein
VPETIGAILLFFLFAVPGMSFELLRQRRRSSWSQTNLEESVRIVIVSILLDTFGVAVYLLISLVRRSAFVSLNAMAKLGTARYSRHHPWALLVTIFIVLTAGEILGLMIHRSLNHEAGEGIATRIHRQFEKVLHYQPGMQIERSDVWQTLFRGLRPLHADTEVTIVTCHGDMWTGTLASYTVESGDVRDLALQQPIEVLRSQGTPVPVPTNWKFVILPASDIREIFVGYIRKDASGVAGSEQKLS